MAEKILVVFFGRSLVSRRCNKLRMKSQTQTRFQTNKRKKMKRESALGNGVFIFSDE